jgi:hypothetical protein
VAPFVPPCVLAPTHPHRNLHPRFPTSRFDSNLAGSQGFFTQHSGWEMCPVRFWNSSASGKLDHALILNGSSATRHCLLRHFLLPRQFLNSLLLHQNWEPEWCSRLGHRPADTRQISSSSIASKTNIRCHDYVCAHTNPAHIADTSLSDFCARSCGR